MQDDRNFGRVITRLIHKEDLSRCEAHEAFCLMLEDRVSAMQQGAFLAALRAKGETEQEVAGSWEAIYALDTTKVKGFDHGTLVENSGTGMDTFKTFNISTAAAIVAAADGVVMARHGARAITSFCGTVDMAEALGVDVECDVAFVSRSIAEANIGLFNGMSAHVHPQALGRILSQIHFGSTLNIAASLANPALPRLAVRGVYDRIMILPVIRVMKAIGYRRAIVFFGGIDRSTKGMDEASVCGTTWCAELTADGQIHEYTLHPTQVGFNIHPPEKLAPEKDREKEARRFVDLIQGRENGDGARRQALLLNAALIYQVAGRAADLEEGIALAASAIDNGKAFATLKRWVGLQNRQPEVGLARLDSLSS
jgi:anthranilate phosphoribosyltransferase